MNCAFFNRRVFTAIIMVVGTSIGAGMLGLPVLTAKNGFFPSVLLMTVGWLLTMLSGLLFSDVLIKQKESSNYISLSRLFLGKYATFVVFFLYIILFYSLITAYTKAIGVLICDDFGWCSFTWQGSLVFSLVLVLFMYRGIKGVSLINNFLSLLMVVSLVVLLFIGSFYVEPVFLTHCHYVGIGFCLPLMISSFGFHGTLPSIVKYLENDRAKIRFVVTVGTTFTFCVYFFWQLIVLGSIPLEGDFGLLATLLKDQSVIIPLTHRFGTSWVPFLARIFSLTAITTSFIGVAIGLIDFCFDAFKVKDKRSYRLLALRTCLISMIKMLCCYKSTINS